MNSEHILAQVMLRSWPFPNGTGMLVKRFFEHLRFRDSETTVTTRDGFPMRIMPNEHVGRYLYLTGEFDRSIVNVMLSHARPGDTLLDIGANIGYMSASFLHRIPRSRVLAVDPQPGVVDFLRANLEPFKDRAQVAPVALSDRNGEASFSIDEVNRGASRITTTGKGDVTVETWTPDRLIETYGIAKVDIIKIDVEGHEEPVLRALNGAIARFRPRLIMFEDYTDKAAPTGAIGAQLSALGYEIKGLRKTLTGVDLLPIRQAADCVFQDYVALLPSRA